MQQLHYCYIKQHNGKKPPVFHNYHSLMTNTDYLYYIVHMNYHPVKP